MDGRDSALARYTPYQDVAQSLTERGQQGFNLYGDAIGANGSDARANAFATFENDPFREFANQNTSNALRDVFRRYNAAGMGDSGSNRLATARVAGEFSRGDINDWMSRLGGYGQNALSMGLNTGTGIAGQQANLDYGTGQQLANLQTNTGNALAGSHLNNALYDAGTRSTGVNNLMRFGDLAVRAASAAMGVPSGGGSNNALAQHSGAYHPWASGTTVQYG